MILKTYVVIQKSKILFKKNQLKWTIFENFGVFWNNENAFLVKRITPDTKYTLYAVGEMSCLRFLDAKPRCVHAYFYRMNKCGAQIKN